MLYLVATPIGNLADFSFRGVETLKNSDYILCEDTRHTKTLLIHYGIDKPLKSFHQFNERLKEDAIVADLLAGKRVSLVSDAGTPGISDPGSKLVQRCLQEGIPVSAIPGACAAILAISCSGFDTTRFQFYGFLPKKAGELKRALQEILRYPATTVCYESPHRILSVLEELKVMASDRIIGVARELTKRYEEVVRGTAEELLAHWQGKEIKGEIVLLIAGETAEKTESWQDLSPEEHVAFLEKTYGLSKHEAIKMAAEIRGVPKREVYNRCLKTED
jgi:16S rRNA (cytidine1402-2'-O)-methyltransferase